MFETDSDLRQSIIKDEKKWFRFLRRRNLIGNKNEGESGHLKRRLTVLAAILSLFYLGRYWGGKEKLFVFVSFSEEDVAKVSNSKYPDRHVSVSSGLRVLILKNRSLLALESIYILLNYPHLFTKKYRKFFLRIFFNWLILYLPHLRNNLYFVKQDFGGASSILVTLSKLMSVKVIGIQHGLMKFGNLETRGFYPGCRVGIELAYDSLYADVLKKNKDPNSSLYILGPPFNCGTKVSRNDFIKTFLFISSGDLFCEEKIKLINVLQDNAKKIKSQFYVRPHPHEYDILREFDFNYDKIPASDTMDRCCETTIFVGFYSTVLYWAACRGFRTVWINDDSDPYAVRDVIFIRGLNNSTIINKKDILEIDINDLFEIKLNFVGDDPVSDRLSDCISIIYPDFNRP